MSPVWCFVGKSPTGQFRRRRSFFGLGTVFYEEEFFVTEFDSNCPHMSERVIRRWFKSPIDKKPVI